MPRFARTSRSSGRCRSTKTPEDRLASRRELLRHRRRVPLPAAHPRRSGRRAPGDRLGGRPPDGLRRLTLRWLCPCAFCRGEAGLPGWLDSAPTLTRGPDPARRHPAGRPVRGLPDLGRRPSHRLLHVRAPAGRLPVRGGHGAAGGRRRTPTIAESCSRARPQPVPRRRLTDGSWTTPDASAVRW